MGQGPVIPHARCDRIFILAGEDSGDRYGAQLASALLAASPRLRLHGIGGAAMRQAGVDLLMHNAALAMMGLLAPVLNWRMIWSAYRQVWRFFHDKKPAVCVLIDYPGFNLRIAKLAKKSGIRVVYYISPQVWAWRQHRIRFIQRWVDHMAVIFPFELPYYHRHAIAASFVGHPLSACMPSFSASEIATLKQHWGMPEPTHFCVGLLPGSRQQEVQALLPVMLGAFRQLRQQCPHAQAVLALAPSIQRDSIAMYLEEDIAAALCIVHNETYAVMAACDLLWTASGTATLEATLFTTPMIVLYKLDAITYFFAKRFVRIPHVGLCNLLSDTPLCPELIQAAANPENLCRITRDLMADPVGYARIKSALEKVAHCYRDQRQSPAQAVAALVWHYLPRDNI